MKNLKTIAVFLLSTLFSFEGYAQIGNISAEQKKAEAGNAQSQYLLGWAYGNGKNGVEQDYEKAFVWLSKSAEQGYEPAQYYLGWCYFYGHGVEKDPIAAQEWYQKAANQGNQEALAMVKHIKRIGYRKVETKQDKFNPATPPILELVSNSVKFVDPNGNNAIDANEKCHILLKVKNVGKGSAYNCLAKSFAASQITGISLGEVGISELKPDEVKEIAIPIKSSLNTLDGSLSFYVQIDEPHGFGTDALQMSVNTKKFESPMVKVVDYVAVSEGGSVLKKKSPFDLQVLLQNVQHGNAEDVDVSISVPKNVVVMLDYAKQRCLFNTIAGGEQKSIIYPLIVNEDYKEKEIPITINVKEKYGRYAENKTITLNLEQTFAANKIVIEEYGKKEQNFEIKVASIGSDVDKNIPVADEKNPQTFAVVIANESYSKETRVPFAATDGRIFGEYCKRTLGLPETNVHVVTNATLNDIRHEIKWLKDVIGAYNGEAKVIFYYAGHGIPDEKQRSAYLLPVDGYASDIATGYALDSLYSSLGRLPSKSVTVFLDACFSGAKREGGMLVAARGVAIKVESGVPVGNMIVLSAAQGDETAFPLKEQGHGMFTYYLLKKLQESKGEASLDDLSDYVITQVRQQSVVVNGKSQTPAINVSVALGEEWKTWKLK